MIIRNVFRFTLEHHSVFFRARIPQVSPKRTKIRTPFYRARTFSDWTPRYGNRTCIPTPSASWVAFRYSLWVFDIYSARYVCYTFWALAANIGTYPVSASSRSSIERSL